MDDKLKRYLNKLDTPNEALAAARAHAITIKRVEQKRQKRWTATIISATVICLFILSIRFSPTIAYAVSKVPGLETIVELITHNKGIEDVLEQGYNEKIYASAELNGVKAVIEEVIADETGMYIMYRLSSEQDLSKYKKISLSVLQNGEPVKAGVGFSTFMDEETYEFASSIEVVSSEGMDYSERNFEVQFMLNDETLRVPFELKNEIKQTKVYAVNEQLEIEGQRFTVKEVHISPLRVGIQIAVDPTNDKRILSFNSIELLDENNEIWSEVSNGVTGHGATDENVMTHYLQSNYFREPKSLTLKISEVEALPKGQDYMEVNFEKQEVIFAPDFIDLSKVEVYPKQLRVQYKPANMKHYLQLLGTAIDATGKELGVRNSSVSGMDGNYHEVTVSYDIEKYTNPVKIYFYSYPSYLDGTAEIKIPMQN
ncbi:DUF4179 domain-containing protein [Solibacillus merdavium]|uniref:DUF4179 domain-containing protein n=1 Tax=Solibacillus merdavium TaxID=2762218 RepID=A0ABR8XSV1_9BACL|nr:DUF4179 domain-containing protein [Solibacillus merdavium]MBD8035018.1 DUF4179 domain-containing protein [Solibacillus merdavium]